MPFENGTPFFLCELAEEAETICPRGLLRRVLAKAAGMGFSVLSALEYEFFLFDETPDSVREKGYRNLKPMTPGFFGYSVLRSSVHAEFYRELLDTCRAMDMALEGLHTETGPGVLEAAIGVDEALRAADKAVLFKTFTKVLAQRCGLMATFMAKWSRDWPGQSGHIHLSLKDEAGRPVFHDAKAERGMSADDAPFHRRAAEAHARASRHGGLDGELLFAADPRLLGADLRHLGDREPHHGVARHSGQPVGAAGRVPHRGGRREPLHRARRRARERAVGHREQGRA